MKRPHTPKIAPGFTYFAAVTILLIVTATGLFDSSAEIKTQEQTASQGGRITPAGVLVRDLTTRQPAVGALSVAFVRSPDRTGPDNRGRYLLVVNSGFGLQFSAATNRAQQSLAVIDLAARPDPAVVQNVYFPTPQSVNVGVSFAPQPEADGSYTLYVAGGFENKIRLFRFRAGERTPLTPPSPGPNTIVEPSFIDVAGFAASAPSPRYNSDVAPVYPTGLAVSADGDALFVANNLDDSLGIITDLRGARQLERIALLGHGGGRSDGGAKNQVYPYDVVALPIPPMRDRNDPDARLRWTTSKVYVSCWNDASIAVVDFADNGRRVSHIPVGRHPTAMVWDGTVSRLYVVNSNDDSVSVIDTTSDREVERINVRLSEDALIGGNPEGLALANDGETLYVANAHSNSVAVVQLAAATRGVAERDGRPADDLRRSAVRGFIPTGQYASAVSVAGGRLFVGNGKGTGLENSSLVDAPDRTDC